MLTFTMDIIKVSTNSIYAGKHWAVRDKYKNDYLMLVKSLRLTTKIKNTCSITFEFLLKGKLLDCSNCSFMGKMIEDALVKVGVLQNDTPEFVKSVTYISKKGTKDIVTVSISEGINETNYRTAR